MNYMRRLVLAKEGIRRIGSLRTHNRNSKSRIDSSTLVRNGKGVNLRSPSELRVKIHVYPGSLTLRALVRCTPPNSPVTSTTFGIVRSWLLERGDGMARKRHGVTEIKPEPVFVEEVDKCNGQA